MAINPTMSFTDADAIKIYSSNTNTQAFKKTADKASVDGGMHAHTGDVSMNDTAGKEKSGFSFYDFLDIINPLQHLPVISTIYRHFTGDEIKGVARIAGGALYGGPVGAGVGGANAIVAQQTGRDIGENLLAGLIGPKAVPKEEEAFMLAEADTPEINTIETQMANIETITNEQQLAYIEEVNEADLPSIAPAAGVETPDVTTMADILWDDMQVEPPVMPASKSMKQLASVENDIMKQQHAKAAAAAYKNAGFMFKDVPMGGVSALY